MESVTVRAWGVKVKTHKEHTFYSKTIHDTRKQARAEADVLRRNAWVVSATPLKALITVFDKGD